MTEAIARFEKQLHSTRDRAIRLELILDLVLKHAKAQGVDLPYVEIDKIRYSSTKKHEAKTTLSQALGHAANDRGAWAERATVATIQDIIKHGPRFAGCKLTSVRAATKEEDRAGVDVIVESSLGTLSIQVKSSKPAVQAVRTARGAKVIFPLLIAVSPTQTDVQIRKAIAGQLTFGISHLRRAAAERNKP